MHWSGLSNLFPIGLLAVCFLSSLWKQKAAVKPNAGELNARVCESATTKLLQRTLKPKSSGLRVMPEVLQLVEEKVPGWDRWNIKGQSVDVVEICYDILGHAMTLFRTDTLFCWMPFGTGKDGKGIPETENRTMAAWSPPFIILDKLPIMAFIGSWDKERSDNDHWVFIRVSTYATIHVHLIMATKRLQYHMLPDSLISGTVKTQWSSKTGD